GASPHFYEFTPRQLAGLSGTETIFAIGYGLDDWVLKAAEAIEGVGIVVVDNGIELRENAEDEHGDEEEHEEDEHGDEEEHEEHGPINPHYWLHFGNARAIADTVAEELSRIDSANAETYRANAEAYKAVLLAEEQLLKERIVLLTTKDLLTFHDSWYYFADNFGLNIVGTFEPSAGREPTPRYLSDLRDKVREHGVSVIFSEPQYSNAAFTPFVNDNNLGFAVLDPIGGTNEIPSFVELMRYNVNTALEALK
ncbi:MAG: metal ABC transporter substrate-binding protein, partial [Candidatus Spechtbacterales bacterium]